MSHGWRHTGRGILLALTMVVVCPSQEIREAVERGEVRRLVADLADDDVAFNAQEAMSRLHEIGKPAIPDLEQALRSEDYQKRQCAAEVLRWIGWDRPSDTMLRVCVEGLRNDRLPRGFDETFTYVFNASGGGAYLLEHVERAEPYLTQGLRSSDQQQRYVCAVVLGLSGHDKELGRVVGILLPHLRGNNISGDAVDCAAAIYRLGKGVIPHLRKAVPDADEQQKQLIELIILDLTDPPKTKEEIRSRKVYNKITTLYHDPVFEYNPDLLFSGMDWGALNDTGKEQSL